MLICLATEPSLCITTVVSISITKSARVKNDKKNI